MESKMKSLKEMSDIDEDVRPKLRMIATSGPSDFRYPFSMGTYHYLEPVIKNTAFHEKQGFRIKVQSRVRDMWVDLV